MSEQQTQSIQQTSAIQSVNLPEEEDTIDLLELFYALLSKWKLLAAATLACALAAALYVFIFVTPQYAAQATIYVLNRRDSVVNMSDLQIGSALTKDYIRVFDMWEVHEKVISNLDLPYTYTQMSKMLTVTNASDTRLLDIQFTSPSPEEAAAVANEYAEVVSDYISENMVTDRPSIMSRARVPNHPVSPNKTKAILLGAMVGFVLSAGIVVLFTIMDDTYKTAEDIRKYTNLVVLASIPLEEGTPAADKKKNAIPWLNAKSKKKRVNNGRKA